MAESRRAFPWRNQAWGCGHRLWCIGRWACRACSIPRAEVEPDDIIARQVTVFGVVATPADRTTDSRLVSFSNELAELIPYHGFKLLDAQSTRIIDGESVTCTLGNGYTVRLPGQSAERKRQSRDSLRAIPGSSSQFSTLVKSPLHQLFFCQERSRTGRSC